MTNYPGFIGSGVLYRKDEICKRLGWSFKSWIAAKKRGLRVLLCGKRAYVKGDDAIDFIETHQREFHEAETVP